MTLQTLKKIKGAADKKKAKNVACKTKPKSYIYLLFKNKLKTEKKLKSLVFLNQLGMDIKVIHMNMIEKFVWIANTELDYISCISWFW